MRGSNNNLRAIWQKVSQPSVIKISMKITYLTHLPLDKMAANDIFMNEKFSISIQISLKFVP